MLLDDHAVLHSYLGTGGVVVVCGPHTPMGRWKSPPPMLGEILESISVDPQKWENSEKTNKKSMKNVYCDVKKSKKSLKNRFPP